MSIKLDLTWNQVAELKNMLSNLEDISDMIPKMKMSSGFMGNHLTGGFHIDGKRVKIELEEANNEKTKSS